MSMIFATPMTITPQRRTVPCGNPCAISMSSWRITLQNGRVMPHIANSGRLMNEGILPLRVRVRIWESKKKKSIPSIHGSSGSGLSSLHSRAT
ncbi:MAG: hypothetical protein BWY82_02433 [Verrucomicrobia bacterium ADurb.Bin474]|nr:MAG: hypothetical protein BWY82_02433 [Verrucomicrobia bacterium ADurb.Bin474]